VNDDDDGGERDAQIVWKGSGDNYQNPSLWGTALLAEESVAVSTNVPAAIATGATPRISAAGTMLQLRNINPHHGAPVVRIIDARGRMVHCVTLASVQNQNVDISGLAHGMYLCDIMQNGSVVVRSQLIR
jgi:hypothetical protein